MGMTTERKLAGILALSGRLAMVSKLPEVSISDLSGCINEAKLKS